MSRLARWCFEHRRSVVLLWLAALVAITAGGMAIGSKYKGDFELPPSESKSAHDILDRDNPVQSAEPNTIVFHSLKGKRIDGAELRLQIAPVLDEIKKIKHVDFLDSPYSDGNQEQINEDGTIAYAPIQIQEPESGTPTGDVQKIMDKARTLNSDDLRVEFGGKSIQDTIQPVPGISEGLGLLLAGIVLFIAFGSLVAMSLPLATAVIALGVSLAFIGMLTHVFPLAPFAPTLAGLMGLGVGVDYALFIVNRHQHNLIAGMSPRDAAVAAIDTTGRAVMFAGIIVCAALLGLVALNITFLGGLAVAAAIAVLVTMLASITLLPALLGFAGIKALSRKQRKLAASGELKERELTESRWYGWAKSINRHPYQWGAAALVVLIVFSIPFFSMRLGASDEGNDPTSATTRKAYDLLATGFGPGHNGPLLLVTEFKSTSDFNTFTNFIDSITGTPGVARISQPWTSPNGQSAVVMVYPTTSPQSDETSELIDRLRSEVIPKAEKTFGLQVSVGGQTASFDDFGSVVMHKLPIFMGVVIGLSFLLLMVVFRSIVVPLKASLMNLLTTTASFGVVVAVFQWGWGGEQIGGGVGPIESFMPVMLFAILFGLSMDYEVFLVARIYEEWKKTGNNELSIIRGQALTGRLITTAAGIMILIFASFILGQDRIIKLFGVGLAAAIIFDAFIVRTILVPAALHVFGKWNWWLPEWLDKRLPNVEIGR